MKTKHPNTLVLAHYYCIPEVQKMADFIGDSLYLSLKAKESNANRIVFASVRFMAETAKIISPESTVILPDSNSTCSLVTQVNDNLSQFKNLPALHAEILFRKIKYQETKVVTYINSSANLKAISDIIVTSANVEEIISKLIQEGNRVLFTPDRNMGAYLKYNNPRWGEDFDYWKGAVCEVHNEFKITELEFLMKQWTDGKKYLIAHPESPLPILNKADMVGSTSKMLKWIQDFKGSIATIYVATEEGLLYNMRKLRPDLDIRQAPTYSGCQCNSCPYMKMNTVESVQNAVEGTGGLEINYIDDKTMRQAREPIERMLKF